ncbi:MAG TPA: hypothetical protein VHG51_15155 [Longimicrobiaceae bacterium]|nr:hypothetical protein [Longimicrobiaceae bacterium]
MLRPIRTAATLAALMLAGCNVGSDPVSPSDATLRRGISSEPAVTTETTDSTVTTRGVYTMGGGN